MRGQSVSTLSVVGIVAFAAGILTANTHFSTPAAEAAPAAAPLDHVVPVGMSLQGPVFLDRNTGDIWNYDLDNLRVSYVGTMGELGKPLVKKPRR